jgi:uncharacterized protein YlzI (FlbEa/FlbD family)
MIKLNGERGETVYISPENIAYIKLTSQGQTGIKIADGYVIVTDSMEEVARKVLEYRLMMADYARESDSDYSNKSWAHHRLHILSGLSEKGADHA